MTAPKIVVIGAGIGGLTAGALLAKAGCNVTVLETQTYPGGSASTFFHQGYRFESGATVAGGFQQPNGPHAVVGRLLDLEWPVHLHDPAWVVHLPDRTVALTRDNADVEAKFPHTRGFWQEQGALAELGWSLSAQGLPWPPTDLPELLQLAKVGLSNFPRDLRLAPYALMTTYQWLKWRNLARDEAFVRFLDAQLLISSQTTTRGANAAYSATALDLARQGVYHVEGGIGGIAEALVSKIEALGGQVIYRRTAERIEMRDGRAVGVHASYAKGRKHDFYTADFVLGNLTPWSLDQLLGEHSPAALRQEVARRKFGWGAFVLHLGLNGDALPANTPDHHQVIADMRGAMGETRTLFMSMSPLWDKSRAPEGQRAVTITTHTEITQWWKLLEQDREAYDEKKQQYAGAMIGHLDRALPGFKAGVSLLLPGTPVTYQFYTGRYMGMVGGFPQTSLFHARSPRTGIANVRLVGDSIFPGQSTAGVSLGALRVFQDVKRRLPATSTVAYSVPVARPQEQSEAEPEAEGIA